MRGCLAAVIPRQMPVHLLKMWENPRVSATRLDKIAELAFCLCMTHTSKPYTSDLLIIGGGMIGLAKAVAAAQGGLSSVVVDRDDPHDMVADHFDGRASAVAQASRLALEAIGVWDHLGPTTGPIKEIRVTDGPSPLFLHYDFEEVGDEPLGHMAENRHIRSALLQAAQSHELITLCAPSAVEELARGGDQVTARLKDGSKVAAKLVVAADGRGSATRQSAGINVRSWMYDQRAIVATIEHARDHEGIAHERFLPAGPFAILPLKGGHHASLVWTEKADLVDSYMALDEAAFLAEIEDRVGGFLGELSLTGPRFSHPLGFQIAERYLDDRLVLVGDAAHGIHPIAGQGLNLGLRDVAALAEVLTQTKRAGLDIGSQTVLEQYQRWRRSDNMLMAVVTDGLNRLFSNDIPPIALARRLGLAAVNQIPPLKALFMRHAMGQVGDLPRLMRGETL